MNEKLCTVVAFDPGETTGWCVMSVAPGALRIDDQQWGSVPLDRCLIETKFGQISCKEENPGVSRLLIVADKYPGAAIVHEDFILDPNKANMGRSLLSPVRITGKFEYAHWMAGLSGEFIVQNRSPVKTTCTDERLKNWGLYDRHSGPHARDAVRHAFYLLRTCRGSGIPAKEARWRAWPNLFDDPVEEAVKRKRKEDGERIWTLG